MRTSCLWTTLVCLALGSLSSCGGQDDSPYRRRQSEPSPSQLFERGVVAFRADDRDGARALFQRIEAGSTWSARARNYLGLITAANDSLRAARDQFKSALDLDPDLAPIHNNLGALYALERRGALAEVAFAQAIRLDPEYPEPVEGQALLLLERGRLEEARSTMATAARIRGRVARETLNEKHGASIQSLSIWPWRNVARRIASEERRRADAAAAGDSTAAADSSTAPDSMAPPPN